ncbi:hypothetical protein EDE05_117100 [Neorhizobium sp. R1-B]|uniref:DUF6538 domain-containing protein n=1 Tax=Neorhizobium sp. R1-B TaxID=2485162 RepID=UPI0010654F68|nr:DUF6538 domain-containing protein [Neorhizobium sp. R1-B]TDX76218.1 hypothetical protein EDE05_117100 [Neorhizobium sp. R1-B]
MVLKMSRPVKLKSGIYHFRKRVPESLQALVGKTEEKFSLQTRDPQEAKVRHARAAAEIELRWHQLSAGRISISQKQATAIAGEIYKELVADHEDNPGKKGSWTGRLYLDYMFLHPEKVRVTNLSADKEAAGRSLEKLRVERNDHAINRYLAKHGYLLDDESMILIRDAVASAVLQAKEHISRLAGGDYRPDPDANRFPPVEIAAARVRDDEPNKFLLIQVFEKFADEQKIASSSYKKWKGIIRTVAKEVPDIRDLTRQWIVDWKDRLLASGIANVSIRDSYLSALRRVCSYGVANGLISENPGTGVTVYVPRKIQTREKEYTATEVSTVLRGTLDPAPARMSRGMRDARRWVPWLCAYTGARVGEIAQLRKQDIQEHRGHWLLWITPEAGTTKDAKPRYVALHSHLVEQGFLQFVQTIKSGPLFYDPELSRGGSDAHPQYKKVGEKICSWIRKDLGVKDDRIRPNHAWRHLFKTISRDVDMDDGATRYMQGHALNSEGDKYGSFRAGVLSREIEKIPRFEI